MTRQQDAKQELWQKIQTEWPELAEFLKELRDHDMKADSVDIQWEAE